MSPYLPVWLLAGLNPFGGLFVGIPLAMFKLGWPPWLAVICTVPLAYGQVVAVDVLWERLLAWPWWVRQIETRRSPKLVALMERKDAKVWIALFGLWVGPWLVAALSRYSGQPVRRVAVPILLSITYVAIGTAFVCLYAPGLLPK
jgi:hypothetical protein